MPEANRNGKRRRTVVVSFCIPKALLAELDWLVAHGYFTNRSEVIRAALYFLLSEIKRREEAKHKLLPPTAEVGYR